MPVFNPGVGVNVPWFFEPQGDTSTVDPDAYRDLILSTSGLISYWRVGESGLIAVDSFGSNPGTYVGSPPLQQSSLVVDGDYCHDFNGTTQYVTIPGTVSLQPASITAEAWVNIDTFSTLDRAITIADDCFGIVIDNTGHVQIFFWNGSVNRTATSTATLTANTTYHLAGTWDDTSDVLTGYINGVADGQSTFAGESIGWTGGVFTSAIATSSGASATSFLDARVDEAAVYNTALSDNTLLGHYTLGATGVPLATATNHFLSLSGVGS